jgi:hypothetical protein
MQIDTYKVMDCSTGHVTNEDINDLLERDDCPVCSYSYDAGVFVYISSSDHAGQLAEMRAFGFSEAFINLIKIAKENDCKFLNLDCDARRYDDLETFDW